jgi:DNA-binding XRE family transcriptional regulator
VILVQSVADATVVEVPDTNQVAYCTETTFAVDDVAAIVNALRARFPAIVGPDAGDVCYAVQNRRKAVLRLVEQHGTQLVLVMGSSNSANSWRMCEVALRAGARAAYLLGSAAQLDPTWLEGVERVGVSAGTSAPERLVQGPSAPNPADWRNACEPFVPWLRAWTMRVIPVPSIWRSTSMAPTGWRSCCARQAPEDLPPCSVQQHDSTRSPHSSQNTRYHAAWRPAGCGVESRLNPAWLPRNMSAPELSFGQQLRPFCLRAGLSREALAERAGLATNAIAALETGRVVPVPAHARSAGRCTWVGVRGARCARQCRPTVWRRRIHTRASHSHSRSTSSDELACLTQ